MGNWSNVKFCQTRSYAALQAAHLDWIIGPGYILGGNICWCNANGDDSREPQMTYTIQRHDVGNVGPQLTSTAKKRDLSNAAPQLSSTVKQM